MTQPDYLDAGLPTVRRTRDLLDRMTTREKAGLLFHPYSLAPTTEAQRMTRVADAESKVEGMGISHLVMANGADARQVAEWANTVQRIALETRLMIPVTFSSDPRSGFKSSAFTGMAIDTLSRWPEHLGFGAIADTRVVEEYGDIVRQEMLAMGIRVYLGPMADLFTDPRWSRGFGTFGEDPAVVRALIPAFINALRGGNELNSASVAAVVKHFPGAGPQRHGQDAIDPRFPDQVYPGGQHELHLRPFEAAIGAGVTQIMVYYGRPIGTPWPEVGFAFNRPVVTGLLRERYGFDGIVTTDWNVISSEPFNDVPFGPIAHGLECATVHERLLAALDAGVDQFGGDTCVDEVCDLVEEGLVSQNRLDQSAGRILVEKFRLGLFENRFVDPELADVVSTSRQHRAAGERAQAAATTLLKAERVPVLRKGHRVYWEGAGEGSTSEDLTLVSAPSEADAIVVRLETPWTPDPDSNVDLHGGVLEFSEEAIERLVTLADLAPLIVLVYLERPAILAPIVACASAVLLDYGASDDVIVRVLMDERGPSGALPVDLPRDVQAVENSREDVPFDTSDPLFSHGYRGGRGTE
jgi:beta-glucosidase